MPGLLLDESQVIASGWVLFVEVLGASGKETGV